MTVLNSSEFDNYYVNNFYPQKNHSSLLPGSIRACIIGKSGCGKTNLLMNLLLKDYLDYNNLYIFAKSLDQPLYQILIKGIENGLNKKEIGECILKQKFTVDKKVQKVQIHYFDSPDEIPDPAEIDSKLKTLIIFDDIMLEKQNKIESYYTRGRHNNIDCFYISQNYIKLPKNTVRENANLFFIFRQDRKNLNHIYTDRGNELDKREFLNFCKESWKEKFSFITIDETSELNEGKFRKRLKYFYVIGIGNYLKFKL